MTPRDRTRCAHQAEQGHVYGLGWSPDGTRIAFGGASGEVGVVTAEGQPGWRKKCGTNWIIRVAWSPDGSRIATASFDGSVRILRAEDGSEERHFTEGSGECLSSATWSPDSQTLAWARGLSPGVVRAVSVTTGGEPRDLGQMGESTYYLSWSPDGTRVAGSLYGGGRVVVLDVASGAERVRFDVGKAYLTVWSPDSRRLLTASGDKRATVHDAESGRLLLAVQGHPSEITTAGWAPGGDLFATSGYDSTVRLWSLEGGIERLCLQGHTGQVWTVAFAPTGGLAASCGGDGTVRVWDVSDLVPFVRSGPVGADTAYLHRQARSVGRRPRGGGGAVDTWVPQLEGAAEREGSLGALRGAGRYLAFGRDARALFAGTNEGLFRRWDLASGRMEWERKGERPWQMSYSAVREGVALGGDADRMRALDARTGEPLWDHQGPDRGWSAYPTAWSPDGSLVAFGSWGSSLRLCDAHSGEVVRTLTGTTSGVNDVTWAPDSRRLASAGGDGKVRVWSAASGECLQTMGPERDQLWSVCWSPDGARVAVGGRAGEVLVWQPDTGQELWRTTEHRSNVYDLAWSPDGSLLASGASDGCVRVWDADSGRELRCFRLAAGEGVASIGWSPNGAFLASGCTTTEEVRLWDVRDLVVPRASAPIAVGGELPSSLRALPGALARLTRCGAQAPLGLLRDLLALTGGQAVSGAVAPLARTLGVQALAGLRWPEDARLGLAALLLHRCDFGGDWRLPEGLAPAQLRDRLGATLADAEDVPPEHYPVPLPLIEEAVAEIDDRLTGLLSLVGPHAVAAEPSLPLRLLPQAKLMPPSVARARRLPEVLGQGGQVAAHPSPWGIGRSGLGTRGNWKGLLPWQWTLPPDALASRQVRGELLFRAGEAREGGASGPLVLLLDVSPACYGPIEAVTRSCATACAQAWQGRGEAVWLVCAGGAGQARELAGPADLAAVWLSRSAQAARAGEALRMAERLRRGLGGRMPGCVLLLAHSQFGWGEEAPQDNGTLRALFVHPRGRRGVPPWAGACQRWALTPADPRAGLSALAEVLA